MLQIYATNLDERVPPGAFPHKFNAFSFHCTTNCAVSHLTAKEHYRLFEFLNDALVHMQSEVLNIETFKMFKTKF